MKNALFDDVTPDAERFLIERLRQLSNAQKMAMVQGLNRTVRDLQMAGLRDRHPQADENELRRLLTNQLLGNRLAEKIRDRTSRKVD